MPFSSQTNKKENSDMELLNLIFTHLVSVTKTQTWGGFFNVSLLTKSAALHFYSSLLSSLKIRYFSSKRGFESVLIMTEICVRSILLLSLNFASEVMLEEKITSDRQTGTKWIGKMNVKQTEGSWTQTGELMKCDRGKRNIMVVFNHQNKWMNRLSH